MAGSMMGRVACECECGGDISASQEDALAASPFLGGDESEVFATPLDLSQQQQQEEEEEEVEDMVTMCTLPSTPSRSPSPAPPQVPSLGADDDEEEVLADLPQQLQEEEEDAVTMCTLSSTPSPTRSPPRRKQRVCVRKVRVRGAKIRTPTPSPDLPPAVEQQQQPAQPTAPEQAEQQPHADADADPLYRAVQMVGALTDATATARSSSSSSSNENAVEDFLALARRRGLL